MSAAHTPGPNYVAPPKDDMGLLSRYADGAAHVGRGRITGGTRRLKLAGFIRVDATGYYTWAAFITAKGRAALAKAVTP